MSKSKGNLSHSRHFLRTYGAGVVYVSVEDAAGDCKIASAFHVGSGWFVTARHVVEHKTLKRIGRTDVTQSSQKGADGRLHTTTIHPDFVSDKVSPPVFHPDDKIDLAVFRCEDFSGPTIRLEPYTNELAYSEYLLDEILVLGYPPIPFSMRPFLVCVLGHVSAVIDHYVVGKRHFILSGTPRGGLSGGVALTLNSQATTLGVVTESLVTQGQSAENGFLTVLSAGVIEEFLHEILT